MEDPETHQSEPLTLLCANWEYNHQPLHQCYWNCRFVVAIMCNLSYEEKQMAAWAVICNSMNKYFEWVTHSGYSMLDTFQYLGIDILEDYLSLARSSQYISLPGSIIDSLVVMFDLPTEVWRTGLQLDHAGIELRRKLNSLHPKLSLR